MLKIRLSRVGRRNQPFFKIVVIPKSAPPKGGKFRDQVGTYDPVNKEVTIDEEKARKWIAQGAQPSDTVHNLFIKHGVIRGRKVAVHDQEPIEPEEKAEEKEETKEEPKKQKVEDKKEEKGTEVKDGKKEEKKEKPESKKEEKETKEKEEDKEEPKEKKTKGKTEEKEEKKEPKEEKAGGLDSLELSTRITNALEDAGIDTVEKLKKKSADELSEVKGLGKKSIEEIMDTLK